jgi:hypothetical protein
MLHLSVKRRFSPWVLTHFQFHQVGNSIGHLGKSGVENGIHTSTRLLGGRSIHEILLAHHVIGNTLAGW